MIESSVHSSMWLAKRVQYTNSLAVGSIVGYIIGLGDRHANNILIDNNTSELTHSDLGIAFDRGMLLPVPERVPFRLTRDLVDALGPFGTNGLFLGSCESSMRVLRFNRDALLGVFDVLLHDPLTDWSGTISKVKGIQNAGAGAEVHAGEEVSLEAESALLLYQKQIVRNSLL
jgi:ataxia telangiectasia mutated family protein